MALLVRHHRGARLMAAGPDPRPVQVVLMALIWFPAVALLVARLGRWLRRPRTARAIQGGSGAALTVLGVVLVTGPLLR